MAEMTVFYCNRSDATIQLIVEPIADTYELDAGKGLTLRFDAEPNGPPIEVEYHGAGDVGIWTHAITQAYRDGVLVRPT